MVHMSGDVQHDNDSTASGDDARLCMWNGKLPVDNLVVYTMNEIIHSIRELIKNRTGSCADVQYQSSAVRDYYGSMALLRWNNAAVKIFDPISTFYPTQDGYIRIHANYPHHRTALLAALSLPDNPKENKSCIAQTIATQSAINLERSIIQHGGIAGAVRSPAEYALYKQEHPLMKPVEYPLRTLKHDRLRTIRNISPTLPLTGVRVLNLTRVLAGPTAGRLLAALGAEVLRIDPPGIPEILEQHLDTDPGVHSAIADYKNSVELQRVHELLAQADAVLLGYRPGALARFGLDPENLTEKYPHLSIVSLSAWQQRTDSIFMRGFDSIVQAVTGISSIYSQAGKPGALPVQALDMTAGLSMAHQIIKDTVRYERSTRHYTLEGFSNTLQDLATNLHNAKHVQSCLNPQAPCLVQRGSAYGTLDYVPPPIWINEQRIDYNFPVQIYGSAQLEWSQ